MKMIGKSGDIGCVTCGDPVFPEPIFVDISQVTHLRNHSVP